MNSNLNYSYICSDYFASVTLFYHIKCPTVIFLSLYMQDLENNMKACKDQFKEFERKDVKHREDLKHLKQKIKKLEDKSEKVC